MGRRHVCPRPCCCSADRNMMIVIPVIYGMERKRQTQNLEILRGAIAPNSSMLRIAPE